MSQTMHVFMTGEAGYHNLGDEAMATASVNRLRQYCPGVDLVATALDPLGAVLRHQARIVPWPLLPGEVHLSYFLETMRKFARKIGFGENFLDPFGQSFEKIFHLHYAANSQFRSVVQEIERVDFVFDMGHGALNDIFSPFMLCFLYFIAGKLKKPLFISGQTVGPLWRRSSVKMLKSTLSYAHTIGLRDVGISKNVLIEQVGLEDTRVRIVEIGDDALDLAKEEPNWENTPERIVDLVQSGEFVAVQWRSSDYTHRFEETAQIIPLINLLESVYRRTGFPIVFIPLSWETRHSDIMVAVRIHDYLSGRIPFYVLWNYMEASHIKWVLGRSKFGLGQSYHFHVLSLSQGVPTIGLYTNDYYEVKLKGAMAAFGYPLAPMSYPGMVENPEQVLRAIDVVMNWNDTDCASLLEYADNARLAWHEAFQKFLYDHQLIGCM